MENKSKTKIIERYIREQIKKNIWVPGNKISTKELADKFDVCTFTVREAMIPLVSEGILLRKPGLGTVIQKTEKNIKGKILIIVPGQKPKNEEYFPEKDIYYSTICKELTKQNYEWKIVYYSEEYTKRNFIKTLMLNNSIFTKDIVGIINHIFFVPKNTFKTLKIPCVNISAFMTKRECEIISSLGMIYFYGLNILTQYSNNIAIFHYNILDTDAYGQKRKHIINTEISKFKNIKSIYISPGNPESAYDTFINTIKNNPEINGILIAEPNLLFYIKKAIDKLKLNVPKDLKIMCITDKNGDYGIDVKWDRLEQNSEETQKKATELLIKKIHNKPTEDKIIIYPKIIKGNSLK